MKKTMLLGIICMMTACLTLSTLQSNAQKKEEDAIKKVLQEETSNYFHKNYAAWAETWAHDSADMVMNAGPYHQTVISGWNAVSAQYKKDIDALPVRSDAEIAPFLNKTGLNIYVNGNVATASFKEGDNTPNSEMRTLVKQNGAWKILNLSWIDNASYTMQRIMGNMRTFVGKWVLDGKATMEPAGGVELNSVEFEMKETPIGMEQLSNFVLTAKNGSSFAPPSGYEFFIPDYNKGAISYMSVRQNRFGQTSTETGIISSDKANSFTVTSMYPGKKDAIQSEFTVSLKDGKWHQVGKRFDENGKQVSTSTMDLHRE